MTIEQALRALHDKAWRAGFGQYLRKGRVPPVIREIMAATQSVEAFKAHLIATGKYSADQPRVPAGNPDGGQWTSGGDGDAAIDDPPIKPVYPLETVIAMIFGGEAFVTAREALGASEIASILEGNELTADNLTSHAAARMTERDISSEQLQEAVQSAQQAGNVVNQIGKYGTVQAVYTGTNGITAIIETAGRNAGKVITAYRH